MTPHFLDLLMTTMLERLKRTVETESARPRKWLKNNCQWVELAGPCEKSEQSYRQRVRPLLSVRPVENDAPAAHGREQVLLKILLPDRAVRVDDEHVPTARTPGEPHRELQQHGRHQPQDAGNHYQRKQ